MRMILTWTSYANKRGVTTEMELRAGDNPFVLATLTKRAVQWEAWPHIPGGQPAKRYGVLENQKKDLEELTRRWFERALAVPPGTRPRRYADRRGTVDTPGLHE